MRDQRFSADADNAKRALERAHKRFKHAAAMLELSESETARKRHGRRMLNAQRYLADARRAFSFTMAAEC